MRIVWAMAAAMALAGQEAPKEDDVVFRSDTTLVRIDVQVLDQDNRAVAGLEKEAFVLREQGQVRAIKNFVREEMPIDLLFLIDVSGSMRPHVERMADAAHQSLPSLRQEDRVAVMVFDRQARLRMPFRAGSAEGRRELDNLLRTERFNGGTDITRAMYEAARFMKKQGRKESRRAVVLLTDDQTEFEADPYGVGRALSDADTVLSALLVPSVTPRGMGRRPGTGTWGRGGVTIGIPGIPGTGGGRRGPVGMNGPRLSSAASAEIAQESGGDSMPADSAAALDTTLNRIRQRYALYFNLPAGVHEGDERRINVALEATVKQRFPLAELRYRKTYIAAASAGAGAPGEETLEVVPMRPAAPRTEEKVITRKRTVDGSSSRGPSIVVH